MIKKNITTTLTEYDSVNELDKIDQQLVEECKKATKNAYAPYSNFHVGAAVLLENNEIIKGNNQENAAYPSGLCAERVALFYANSKFPDKKVKTIAISAKSKGKFTKSPVGPCGSCRQVILETENRFKSPIKIILYSEEKIQVVEDASSLLPISFTEDFLKST
jgi:cytidine deaminase